MDYLKPLFGDGALTYDQFASKVAEAGEGIKLANLADGHYVSRVKYDEDLGVANGKLETANGTITTLQDTLRKFDGVDVDGLRTQIQQMQQKYDSDIEKLTMDAAIAARVRDFGARNPQLVAGAVDRSKISRAEDGTLTGLDEQLEGLKSSDEYLFNIIETQNIGTGHKGSNPQPGPEKDPEKMSMNEYRKYRSQM